MKRLSLLLVVLLLGALALVACGGGGAPAAPAATSAPAQEEAAPPAQEEAAAPSDALTCDDAIGCVEVAAGDPIQIASALVISGPNTDLGLDSQRGVELAIKMRGDVLGHSVTLMAEDEGCSAEGGQTAASKIVANPQVVGAIATSCSGAGVPFSQAASDAGLVTISPSNTSPALTDPAAAWHPGYFRTAHNDLVQGAAMADWAYDVKGFRRAVGIHDGDPYTEGLVRAFADAFTAKGGEMVGIEASTADATDVAPLLTSVAAAKPDFIYLPVFIPLGSLIVNTAKTIPGLEGVQLAAADGVQSPSFLENVVGTGEGMVASGPDLAFSNTFYNDTFVPAYEAAYGTKPTAPFHAHAFDATNILLDAIEKVAKQDAEGNLLIGRQALRDAVAATSGFQGITGTLTCSQYGDCADAKISVSEIQNGEYVRIWP